MGPGIVFAVLAMASLSFSDATSQWVLLSVSPVMVLWFRYAVQALGTTLVLAPLRGRAMWRSLWTETGAGPPRAVCPGRWVTRPASRR